MEPLSHHLQIVPPEGGLPAVFTVELTPYAGGSFLVACRELPEVLTYGVSEEEALLMAELAIRERLGHGRRASRPPG